MMDFRVTKKDERFAGVEVTIFQTAVLNSVAGLAAQLLEKWGPVVAEPDGEDSSGRQKLRKPSVQEVVARSFDMAEELWRVALQRGHVLNLPDLNAARDFDAEALAVHEESVRAANDSSEVTMRQRLGLLPGAPKE